MQTFIVENSSTIDKVFYNEQMKSLTVQFKSGQQYKYENVSQDDFENLKNSESKGKFVNEVIKPKEFSKVQLND